MAVAYQRWMGDRKVHMVVNGEAGCESHTDHWFTSDARRRVQVTRAEFKQNGCGHCKWAAGIPYPNRVA